MPTKGGRNGCWARKQVGRPRFGVRATFDGAKRSFAYGSFAFTCAAATCIKVVAGPLAAQST